MMGTSDHAFGGNAQAKTPKLLDSGQNPLDERSPNVPPRSCHALRQVVDPDPPRHRRVHDAKLLAHESRQALGEPGAVPQPLHDGA
eukprot:199448-Pyramimonas_sp.AAC.1